MKELQHCFATNAKTKKNLCWTNASEAEERSAIAPAQKTAITQTDAS